MTSPTKNGIAEFLQTYHGFKVSKDRSFIMQAMSASKTAPSSANLQFLLGASLPLTNGTGGWGEVYYARLKTLALLIKRFR